GRLATAGLATAGLAARKKAQSWCRHRGGF
ncbi:hypothetical protein S7711_09893, partial [Stachybotrys chartarum IBT 7711]